MNKKTIKGLGAFFLLFILIAAVSADDTSSSSEACSLATSSSEESRLSSSSSSTSLLVSSSASSSSTSSRYASTTSSSSSSSRKSSTSSAVSAESSSSSSYESSSTSSLAYLPYCPGEQTDTCAGLPFDAICENYYSVNEGLPFIPGTFLCTSGEGGCLINVGYECTAAPFSPGEQINDSLMYFIGALPIVVLAVTGIVGIVLALVALIIVIVLIGWFKEILMLPLDLVKGKIRSVR